MKKIVIIALSLLIFSSAFCQVVKNSNAKVMTAQDSAAAFQTEYNKFIDSLVQKTSVKQLFDFLTENVTVKQWQDGKWVDMYDFFLRTKGNEWIQKRKKN